MIKMMPMANPTLPLEDMPLEVAASAIAVAEAVVDERDLVAVAVLEAETYEERRVDDETVTAMEVGRAEAEERDDESTTATAAALLPLVVGGR
jgi:hypothetical protein